MCDLFPEEEQGESFIRPQSVRIQSALDEIDQQQDRSAAFDSMYADAELDETLGQQAQPPAAQRGNKRRRSSTHAPNQVAQYMRCST